MLFEFRGTVCSYHGSAQIDMFTNAKSLEEAIRNFTYQGKSKLGLITQTNVWLQGSIYINYNVAHEIVKINNKDIQYELDIKSFIKKGNKYEFENELLSREELLYKIYNSDFLEEESKKINCKYENSAIIYKGNTYEYDEEEGVYWLNGVRFSEYIIRKDV